MKISFHSYANKIILYLKSFALSVAFIMRLTATWNWPIVNTTEMLDLFLAILLLSTIK